MTVYACDIHHLPMFVPVDQSNYKSILVKLGNCVKTREYWKRSVPWLTVANKMDPVNTLSVISGALELHSASLCSSAAKAETHLCVIQLQQRVSRDVPLYNGRLWVLMVCHRGPVLICVRRLRGLLTHGWRDRRRCTRRWSLCRCRTRQSGTAHPGCCFWWSEKNRGFLHNTCEGKRSVLLLLTCISCLGDVHQESYIIFWYVLRIYANRNIKVKPLGFEEKSRHLKCR